MHNNRTDNRVLPLLQAMFAHDADGISDGQLLRRFLNENDFLKIELAAADNKMAKIAVCEAHLKKTEQLLNTAKAKHKTGQIPVTQFAPILGQLGDLKAQLHQARNAK